jgi:hypothetical protein
MKKIGFVDYYLSEWHANNYPNWLREECEKRGLDYKLAYAWAELDISPRDNKTTDEWCAEFGATRCKSLEELCEKSDVIVILCPSNPEKHLGYAEVVLPYGKPTYIDKTFAPDLDTAKKIFAIAEKHGTKFFSTSALRYATELGECEPCTQIMTTGGGRDFAEYIVHQAEMVVYKLGLGAEAVKAEAIGDQLMFRVRYPDGRAASMIFGEKFSFTAYMNTADNHPSKMFKIASDYFKLLMADIVNFFESGEISFNTAETLEVMSLRESALKAIGTPDTWVEIAK